MEPTRQTGGNDADEGAGKGSVVTLFTKILLINISLHFHLLL